MKKLFFILIALMPTFTYAFEDGAVGEIQLILGERCSDGSCGFDELSGLINQISIILMTFTTAVATILFVYAGFLYITSQGDTNKVKQATTIFRNVAIGFVIILVSYLLVREFLIKIGLEDLVNALR